MALSRPVVGAPSPRAVTVVSGGENDCHDFMDWLGIRASEWMVIDCRPWLEKDPGDAIGHKQDCTAPLTQRTVIAQHNFPEIVEYILSEMLTRKVSKFMVHCKTGYHRASTVTAMVEDYANCALDPRPWVRITSTASGSQWTTPWAKKVSARLAITRCSGRESRGS